MALVRGPAVPAESGKEVLPLLRSYVAEIQDVAALELRTQGLIPVAGVKKEEKSPAQEERGKEKKTKATKERTESTSAPAATAKVLAKPSRSPSKRGRKKESEELPGSNRAESSHRSKPSKRDRSPSSDDRRRRKSRKKSPEEGRGRSRRREKTPRLASPVRPTCIAEEPEEEVKEEEADEVEPERPVLVPRPPSRSPPRRALERRPAPTRRPTGAHWEGPIYARRREPAPGTGRHHGKDKGEKKRRQRDYISGRWR